MYSYVSANSRNLITCTVSALVAIESRKHLYPTHSYDAAKGAQPECRSISAHPMILSSDTTLNRHVNIAAIAGSVVGGVLSWVPRFGRHSLLRLSTTPTTGTQKSATRVMRLPAHALVEPPTARPGLDSSEYTYSNEKAYVRDSLTSLAFLPAPARANDTRTHSRTESATSPDLVTVARQVERIAHFLDAWSPSERAPQTEYLVPPRTAPPQYSRTSTSRS